MFGPFLVCWMGQGDTRLCSEQQPFFFHSWEKLSKLFFAASKLSFLKDRNDVERNGKSRARPRSSYVNWESLYAHHMWMRSCACAYG